MRFLFQFQFWRENIKTCLRKSCQMKMNTKEGSSRCSTDYFRWMWMWCNKNSNTIWFILATINSGCNWDCFLLKGMAGYFYHRSMFSPSQVFLRLSRIHRMIGVLICKVLNIVICIQIFLNVLAPIFKSVIFFVNLVQTTMPYEFVFDFHIALVSHLYSSYRSCREMGEESFRALKIRNEYFLTLKEM